MAKDQKYERWTCSADDLKDLTPVKVRDLIVECFFHAQQETFARAKERMGGRVTDESICTSVVSAIRVTFEETGGDFEHPTKESLGRVVQTLAQKAAGWGTPPDIIQHHGGQIMNALAKL